MTKKRDQRKVNEFLDIWVQFAKEAAPHMLKFENLGSDNPEYQEIFPESIEDFIKEKRRKFLRKIPTIEKKRGIKLDKNFFTKMIAHFKVEYILYNIYEVTPQDPFVQDIIKDVINKKNPEALYLNTGECIMEILVKINEMKGYKIKSNINS